VLLRGGRRIAEEGLLVATEAEGEGVDDMFEDPSSCPISDIFSIFQPVQSASNGVVPLSPKVLPIIQAILRDTISRRLGGIVQRRGQGSTRSPGKEFENWCRNVKL
jgi:hypothetical protein